MSAMQLRVQLAEAWDSTRFEVPQSEQVSAVKVRALDSLDSEADAPEVYVVTYRGEEILDESASLADAGVVNGSTLLISRRRRRPVR